jgi:transposase
MNKIGVIGLDLAKNVFQVHGIDHDGEVVVRKQLKRSQVHQFFVKLEPCLIGMEACAGARYWSRELTRLGHCTRMMAPVFVKPYLKSNKNDPDEAEAICKAVQRPNTRFVAARVPAQQPILHLHHGRQLSVRQRVALMPFTPGNLTTENGQKLTTRICKILPGQSRRFAPLGKIARRSSEFGGSCMI